MLAPLHSDSEQHADKASYTGFPTWSTRLEDMQALSAHIGERAYVAAGHSYGALTALVLGGVLTLGASVAYDQGLRCVKEAGIAKYFSSEAAVENSQEAMRIYGGYSYSKEYDIERYYRDSMLM
ncbi:MAG: acyl-CoA dehydrogenase family protein, partial [Marinomonas sp.]